MLWFITYVYMVLVLLMMVSASTGFCLLLLRLKHLINWLEKVFGFCVCVAENPRPHSEDPHRRYPYAFCYGIECIKTSRKIYCVYGVDCI